MTKGTPAKHDLIRVAIAQAHQIARQIAQQIAHQIGGLRTATARTIPTLAAAFISSISGPLNAPRPASPSTAAGLATANSPDKPNRYHPRNLGFRQPQSPPPKLDPQTIRHRARW